MDRAIGSTHPYLDDVRTEKPPFHSVKLHSVNYKKQKRMCGIQSESAHLFSMSSKGRREEVGEGNTNIERSESKSLMGYMPGSRNTTCYCDSWKVSSHKIDIYGSCSSGKMWGNDDPLVDIEIKVGKPISLFQEVCRSI